MTLEATAGAQSAASSTALPRRTFGGLVSISLFWFALNFIWIALPSFIIPFQVVGLLLRAGPTGGGISPADWANAHKEVATAIVLAPGLVVAVITNPLFGLFSDRTPGRFGRRRPYILGGTMVNVAGLAMMAFLPVAFIKNGSGQIVSASLIILMVGLMVVQFSNNAAAAPFHALLPDLVPEEQRGVASGIMGVAYWVGTLCGSLLPILFDLNYKDILGGKLNSSQYQHNLVLAYGVIACILALMALLTIALVHERPLQPSQLTAKERAEEAHTTRDLLITVGILALVVAASVTVFQALFGSALGSGDQGPVIGLELVGIIVASIGAARAFGFRPRRNPDFSWVLITRMFIVLGVYIVLDFMQFYFGDIAHQANPAFALLVFLAITVTTAAVSTGFGGWASDRFGRKRLVYISGAFMAIVGAAFVLAPYLIPGDVFLIALIAGGVFGLGYGAYVSVDWALVTDVLPSEENFARDMGIWNIGLTFPQVFAAVFGGFIIDTLKSLGQLNLGYTVLFSSFVMFCVLGTVTVRNIKGVKG
jgi:Na+/melibiose symporter-like transporter